LWWWFIMLAKSKVLRGLICRAVTSGSNRNHNWLKAGHTSDNVHCTPGVHHLEWIWVSTHGHTSCTKLSRGLNLIYCLYDLVSVFGLHFFPPILKSRFSPRPGTLVCTHTAVRSNTLANALVTTGNLKAVPHGLFVLAIAQVLSSGCSGLTRCIVFGFPATYRRIWML
jgi:hypothetical protein